MNTFRRMESLCGDRLHHVYDALSGAGFRSSLTGATIMCLFAVIAVGCGDDEPASPGPTEPRTTEPTATDPTTQPTVTKEPTGQPTPTEPTPTKGGGMSQSPEPAPPVLTDGD